MTKPLNKWDWVFWITMAAAFTVCWLLIFGKSRKVDADAYTSDSAITIDGNLIIDYNDPNEYIMLIGVVYINGAEIERDGENRLKCNVSSLEFRKRLYNCLNGPKATGEVIIEFAEPNEIE
jgi:hypothetical protein